MRQRGFTDAILALTHQIEGHLMKAKLYAMLLIFSVSLPAMAQMISENSASATPISSTGLGQSFTATASGNITRITARPQATYNGTLHIYNGNVGSGIDNNVGTPVYTQPGVNLASTSLNGPMRDIVLSTPFPVVAGQTYTFVLSGDSWFGGHTNNPYPDGTVIGIYASPVPTWDLSFEVWITTVTQTINFTSTAPASVLLGGSSYTVSATGGASNNPVVFSIDPSASTICTISGATVTFLATGTCTINANQAGNTAYDAATQVQQRINVIPRPPASIPTLSQWGLMVLAGLLALLGVMRRRSH